MTGPLLERSEQLRVLASAARAPPPGRGSLILVYGEGGVVLGGVVGDVVGLGRVGVGGVEQGGG